MLHPHVPEDLKHFGKHLFATFLGLLMALGLESWHQSHLHAEAARHSRAFIARELAAPLPLLVRVSVYRPASGDRATLHRG